MSLCHRTPTSRPRVSNRGKPLLGHDLVQKSRLSSSRQSYKAPPPNNKSDGDKKTPVEDQSLPSFKFSDLGASKRVRLVVITALVIYGTLESIFWMQVLWAKFGPAPKDEDVKGESNEGKPVGT